MTETAPSITVPLTILEEFLLLALDDKAENFYALPRTTLDCACVGAVLMDLTLRLRIDNDLRHLFVTDIAPTGDNLLDPILQLMAMAPVVTPHPITFWLRQLLAEGEPLREKALRRLVQRGIVTYTDKKILWALGKRSYPLVEEREMRDARLRIMGVILQDDIPTAHDIMLTALAQACGLFEHMMESRELKSVTPRIAQVASMDLIGQAVAKAVVEIQAAIAMASGFR
jgi:hypothetical protein